MLGDGVNIASRIQTAARPGGICISDHVYMQVRDKLEMQWQSRGELKLKNIERPMEVFDIIFPWEKEQAAPPKSRAKTKFAAGKYLWPIIAVAAVVLIVGYFWKFPSRESAPTYVSPPVTAAPELPHYDSIAVLPFENMSNDQENVYFARGIHEDILTSLAKVKALKVISRTSVMEYENKTRNLRKIAEDLGVSTILEGSVRRSGMRVKITAQLIDAKTDEHLWAESYDRDLTDIFALQSTIAEEITGALKATLSPEEKENLERLPTQSGEAYDIYLRARDYHLQAVADENAAGQAERLYGQAIGRDPSFALAHAWLAHLHSEMYWQLSVDRSEERLQKLKSSADRALQLQPDLPEGQTALANYYYYGFRNYGRAQGILERVRESLPNNAEVLAILSYIERRQGQWELSTNHLEKAVGLDPRNVDYKLQLALSYYQMRDLEAAIPLLDEALEIQPDAVGLAVIKGRIYLGLTGDTSVMKKILDEIPPNLDPYGRISNGRFVLDIWERDFEGALPFIEAFAQPVDDGQSFVRHRDQYRGMLYHYMGDKEKSRRALESALAFLEPALAEHPKDARYHASIGSTYALLERKEEAIEAGIEAVKLMPQTKDALVGNDYERNLAGIYANVGEPDKAIDLLEDLLSKPGRLAVPALRNLCYWDPLRSHPRFQALLAKDGG